MTLADKIEGLRDLANWLEENEGAIEALGITLDRSGVRVGIYCGGADSFAEAVALLGPNTHIEYPEKPGDHFVRVHRDGPGEIYAYARAENVCEKVAVEMVERVDWKLRPILTDEQRDRGDALLMAEAHAVTG